MWIVRNTLRGVLRFPGLNISIPPREEFDLDSVLPREVSENSNQLQVAFEEGYLQNIRKDPLPEEKRPEEETTVTAPQPPSQDLEEKLEAFKRQIVAEIQGLLPQEQESRAATSSETETVPSHDSPQGREILAELSKLQEAFRGDVEAMRSALAEIQKRLSEEKRKILEDERLSEAELRARLKFLEEQEHQIGRNFERLGQSTPSTKPKGKGLVEKADLLSDL